MLLKQNSAYECICEEPPEQGGSSFTKNKTQKTTSQHLQNFWGGGYNIGIISKIITSMESPKNYRDNLAQKLKDIRSIGDHGKEAAQVILQGEQATEQYQEVKDLHREMGDLLVTYDKINQQINELTLQTFELKKMEEQVFNELKEKQLTHGLNRETMPFPIGNRIKLPANKTSEQYLRELSNRRIDTINMTDFKMIKEIGPLKSPQSIKIVLLSLEQLGFPDGATLQEIYDKAESMGLELCPPQAVFELGLRYDNNFEEAKIDIADSVVAGLIGDESRTIRLFYPNDMHTNDNRISIDEIIDPKKKKFVKDDYNFVKFCFRKP